MELHRTLVSLGAYLQDQITQEDDFEKSHTFAFALVCSARFMLYDMYGCNDHASELRIAEEISMQQTALDGLLQVVNSMAHISRQILRFASVADDGRLSQVNPLLCQCIYLAITECSWLYREEKSRDRAVQLRDMIDSLQALGRVWRTVGMLNACYKNGKYADIICT